MRSRIWEEDELKILEEAIQSGRSSWQIAMSLASKMNRTVRAIDTKIRDLKNQIKNSNGEDKVTNIKTKSTVVEPSSDSVDQKPEEHDLIGYGAKVL